MPWPLWTSIFSQLNGTLGACLISQSNNCSPYQTVIEFVLSYSNDTRATQFSAGLFYKDNLGHHKVVMRDGGNQGFRRRVNLMGQSKKIVVLAHLHSDVLFQEKLSLNGVDVKMKPSCGKDAVCLMGARVAGW